MLRTHTTADLTKKAIGQKVTLAGWVHRRRDHGGLIFIDLRDKDGLVQIVLDPKRSAPAHKAADAARSEYVVQVSGVLRERPEGRQNPALATGQVEVIGESFAILNPAKNPPFYINEEIEVEETLRLRYRYLDLRRQRMRQNIVLRHRITSCLREFLDARGFVEIETPISLSTIVSTSS